MKIRFALKLHNVGVYELLRVSIGSCER